MLNIIKKSNKILKNNLIFIQPLLMYLLMILTSIPYIINNNIFYITRIIIFISMILLTIAFSAGYFYINKLGIINYNENDEKEEITIKSIQNFKKFFEGVGAYFIKTFCAFIISSIISFICLYFTFKFCNHFIGIPNFINEIPKLLQATSQAEILNIINNISFHDLSVFILWMLVINTITSLLSCFTLIYFSVLNFENFNLIKSLIESIKFILKNILEIVLLLLYICLIYILLNIISAIFGTNSFGQIITIILFTIYLNYYVILVFCFYNEKTKNNSNNRTEFIG